MPLLRGAIPGIVLGAVLRVEVLDGPRTFLFVVAAVLAPVGASLLVGRAAPASGERQWSASTWWLTGMAFCAGTIGGVYRIGGGSLLGPVLTLLGLRRVIGVLSLLLAGRYLLSGIGVV